jgi:small-conductance mechanosensitive channel
MDEPDWGRWRSRGILVGPDATETDILRAALLVLFVALFLGGETLFGNQPVLRVLAGIGFVALAVTLVRQMRALIKLVRE